MEEGLRNNLIVAVVIVVLLSLLGGLSFIEGMCGRINGFTLGLLGISLLFLWNKRKCI